MIITTFVGHISNGLATEQLTQFRMRLERMEPAPTWIMDCSSLSTFEPSAVPAGSRWFDLFRKHQGRTVLLVSSLPAARMAAATIGFGVGLQIRTFDELRDALDELGLRPDSPSITRLEPAAELTSARSAPTMPMPVLSTPTTPKRR